MRTDGFAERLLDLVGERLRGLESGNVVLGNNDRRIFEMLRAVFCARFFRMKLPKPRR